MDKHEHRKKIKLEIAAFNRLIDWYFSKRYRNHYRKEQQKALIRYFLTRKLPKNKEWMFTKRKVGFSIVYFSRKKTRYSLAEKLSHLAELSYIRLCFLFTGRLPQSLALEEIGSRIRIRKFGIMIPHLIRSDHEEHWTLLHMFRDEKTELVKQNEENGEE